MSKHYSVLPALKRESILSLLKRGERLDGRALDEFRSIKIETGVIGKAEGSALVRLGDTKVVAGVKVEIGKPFPDTPDKGVQIVNAELVPLAAPFFEPGPPGEEDIELARVIDRGLRSAEMIKLDELAIVPGEKVWIVYVDLYSLDHYGNLIDASGLAAVSALLTARMRRWEVENGEVNLLEETIPLPVASVPVFVTIAKIGDNLLVDPTYEEELVMDARITFAINEKGEVCGIQKGGPGGFTPSEVKEALGIALETAEKIRPLLPLRDKHL